MVIGPNCVELSTPSHTACKQAVPHVGPRPSQAAVSPKRVWHGLLVSRDRVAGAGLGGLGQFPLKTREPMHSVCTCAFGKRVKPFAGPRRGGGRPEPVYRLTGGYGGAAMEGAARGAPRHARVDYPRPLTGRCFESWTAGGGSAKPGGAREADSVRLLPTTTWSGRHGCGHGAPTASAAGAAADESTTSAPGDGMGTSWASVVR